MIFVERRSARVEYDPLSGQANGPGSSDRGRSRVIITDGPGPGARVAGTTTPPGPGHPVPPQLGTARFPLRASDTVSTEGDSPR